MEVLQRVSTLLTLFLVICFPAKSQDTDSVGKALIEVNVSNFDGLPVEGEQIIFEALNSTREYKGVTNSEGRFEILLQVGETYKIRIKSVGEARDYNTLELPALGENESYGKTVLTIQFEQPRVFTLDNVEFESGKSALTRESYSELEELFEYMKLKEDLVVEIAGHTDDVGDEESNIVLSEARANAVRNYLIRKGISPERVKAKGYGESEPIATNTNPEGRQRNRRTEVRILSE